MYTYTTREININNQRIISYELNKLCDGALAGNDKIATNYEGVYRSYHYNIADNKYLTQLLYEQSIYPTSYLCSIIDGNDGIFKAHRDKQRELSIMYIKTDDKSTTNHYYPKKDNNNRFYDDNEIVLVKSTILEQNKLYLFNHQTIHSVTGISSQRCNISINLET